MASQRTGLIACGLAAYAFAATPAFAGPEHPHFDMDAGGTHIGAQVRAQARIRAEARGDNAQLPGDPSGQIEHRLRLGTTLSVGDMLQIGGDIQDVRIWGGEQSLPGKPGDATLFGYAGAGIDFHTAFMRLNFNGLTATLGRQEISWDSQRLIGAVDWTMQARRFDGARVQFKHAMHDVDAFVAVVQRGDQSDPDAPRADNTLAGIHYAFTPGQWLKLAPSVLVDVKGDDIKPRVTTGGRASGGLFGFGYDMEAYYQGTRTSDAFTHAFLFALRGSYTAPVFSHPHIGFFSDIVSGDSDLTSTSGSSPFDTLYATNHKFYGHQDFFLNIPAHTQGRGLFDTGLSLGLKEGDMGAKLDVHLMGAADLRQDFLYGVEPDFNFFTKVIPRVTFKCGVTGFYPLGSGERLPQVFTPWMYGMIAAQI